ncbi:hypothetical protein [Mycobacterium hubeiense]|uniref:hypothetical protein n=1 Tax=Mycobacterium hubeiense TaxID=1867256 RepID=UPI000C7F304C|nr:hypothetical protein [Mycobacterium sp. QGD 101]
MKVTKLVAASAITGSLGLAALGVGAGIASADPPMPGPGGPGPVHVEHRPDVPPQDRDAYFRAVRDHRPFRYQGHWVTPVFDPGHRGWGFWLGPIWIPLL